MSSRTQSFNPPAACLLLKHCDWIEPLTRKLILLFWCVRLRPSSWYSRVGGRAATIVSKHEGETLANEDLDTSSPTRDCLVDFSVQMVNCNPPPCPFVHFMVFIDPGNITTNVNADGRCRACSSPIPIHAAAGSLAMRARSRVGAHITLKHSTILRCRDGWRIPRRRHSDLASAWPWHQRDHGMWCER